MFKKNIFTKKKTGLALGGGSTLGAAHIGVLKTLKEEGIEIDCISGTSVGALVASLYAFGKSYEEIEKISMEMKWPSITKLSPSKYGLLSNEKLGEIIIKHIGNVNIQDSKIPLRIVASDIEKGEKVILKKGNLAKAVRASSCIPGIFTPIKIDNRILVDGGVFENVPISPLKKMKVKKIIAVNLLSNKPSKKPRNIFEILLNTFNYMILSSSQIQESDVDVMIKPDVSSFSRLNSKNTPQLIKKGYEVSKKAFKH